MTRFYSTPADLGPIFRIVPFKNGRPINRTLEQSLKLSNCLSYFLLCTVEHCTCVGKARL